jgi:protein involved in polysaccharide export with SLBB domain
MIEQLRKMANPWVVALGLVLTVFLSGCQSGPKYTEASGDESGNMFHVGDLVTVIAVPISGKTDDIPDHTERIGEDGKITLQYIGPVTAAGKTPAELQREIHDLYVPIYFKGLTVTVHGEARYFYVNGEVRQPNKYEYNGSMSVVRAISVAGGFTDFAKRTKVQLTHNGKTRIINVDKAIKEPRLDLAVFPGDTIYVPRRLF